MASAGQRNARIFASPKGQSSSEEERHLEKPCPLDLSRLGARRADRAPSPEMFRASSDFDAKLDVMRAESTATLPMNAPLAVSLSRKIGELTPNEGSTDSFLKTFGKLPSVIALPPPGKAWPTRTVPAVPAYVVRETIRPPG
jgi:hypothetical protein